MVKRSQTRKRKKTPTTKLSDLNYVKEGDFYEQAVYNVISNIVTNYANQGIHIHAPEGATPKDGPSAGTAITVALYSLFINKPIRHNVAITGEINLSGRVTAIGGLDLKILGGIRAGVKRFLFPKENQLAFDKFMENHIEDSLIQNIEFYSVEKIEEVFELVF